MISDEEEKHSLLRSADVFLFEMEMGIRGAQPKAEVHEAFSRLMNE
jgi:hypothetical protein